MGHDNGWLKIDSHAVAVGYCLGCWNGHVSRSFFLTFFYLKLCELEKKENFQNELIS